MKTTTHLPAMLRPITSWFVVGGALCGCLALFVGDMVGFKLKPTK